MHPPYLIGGIEFRRSESPWRVGISPLMTQPNLPLVTIKTLMKVDYIVQNPHKNLIVSAI